jgi:hypothetical protein
VSFIEEIDKNRGGKVRDINYKMPLSSSKYVAKLNKKSPEAMLKIVSYGSGNGSAKNLLNYISRANEKEDDVLDMEDQDGLIHHGKEEVRDLFSEWKEDFEERKVNGTKKPTKLMLVYLDKEGIETSKNEINRKDYESVSDALKKHFGESLPSNLKSNMRRYEKPRVVRHTTHIVLSTKTENTPKNVKRVNDAARKFLNEEFAKQGYEFAFVTHNDTENPHTHVVVKNKNKETGKKLRIDPVDLLYLRTEYANALEKEGIKHKATRRLDRVDALEKIAQGIERVHENNKRFGVLIDDKKRINLPAKKEMLENNIERLKKEILGAHLTVKEKSVALKEISELRKQAKVLGKDKDQSQVVDSTINMVSKEVQELVNKADNIERSKRSGFDAQKDEITTLVAYGYAPYNDDEKNKESFFVETSDGKKIWGIDLSRALEESRADVGDLITIRKHGEKQVEVFNENDGKRIKTNRNEWVIENKTFENDFKKDLEPTPERDKAKRLQRASERNAKREVIAKISERKIKEINTAMQFIRSNKDIDDTAKTLALETLKKNKQMLEHLVRTKARTVKRIKIERTPTKER